MNMCYFISDFGNFKKDRGKLSRYIATMANRHFQSTVGDKNWRWM